jgi:hypothetical protein
LNMKAEQQGCCGACGFVFGEGLLKVRIDHCAITRKVRGLLCNDCNLAAGLVWHSVSRCRGLEDYLRRTDALTTPRIRDRHAA